MKCFLLALSLAACGIAAGTQERPKLIRVSLQFIEVPHASLTEMLAGPGVHEKAIALSKDGRGKILESCTLVCLSGQKASLETIREEIYPTEYTPPQLPCGNPSNVRLASDPPVNPATRSPTAFDTRDTGVTFELEALAETDGSIELRLSPEIVTRLRLETWMEHTDRWGDGSVRMPIFQTLRAQSSITVAPGKFELVSALTPKMDPPAPAVSRKILVFVRADVLPLH